MYEATACITIMLSRVAQNLKALSSAPGPEGVSAPRVNETLKQILDHAKTAGLVDHLCFCLATSGSSLNSGSSNMLRAACEACRAIWSLIDALEVHFTIENAYLFPLNAFWSHSLLRLDIRDSDRGSLVGPESVRIVDALTRAFLRSKAVQLAITHCLHQHAEATLSAVIQVFVPDWLKFLLCCVVIAETTLFGIASGFEFLLFASRLSSNFSNSLVYINMYIFVNVSALVKVLPP